jgi:hypothetical protein
MTRYTAIVRVRWGKAIIHRESETFAFRSALRALYETEPAAFCEAVAQLLGMQHVVVERWEALSDAVDLHLRGLDFADALHWTSSSHCREFASFDDRRFVRRARRMDRECVAAGGPCRMKASIPLRTRPRAANDILSADEAFRARFAHFNTRTRNHADCG